MQWMAVGVGAVVLSGLPGTGVARRALASHVGPVVKPVPPDLFYNYGTNFTRLSVIASIGAMTASARRRRFRTGGEPMVRYVILLNFTDQGIRNVKQTIDRAKAFRALAEKHRATLKDLYWTQGRQRYPSLKLYWITSSNAFAMVW
jgi:hypothetical protein